MEVTNPVALDCVPGVEIFTRGLVGGDIYQLENSPTSVCGITCKYTPIHILIQHVPSCCDPCAPLYEARFCDLYGALDYLSPTH